MRFVRHAKIFRGPLDAAPVAGVLLLLMMFMLLSSLIYTPGVLVDLGKGAQNITVTRSNTIAFAGKTYTPGELDQLRNDLKTWPRSANFSVTPERGADPDLARQVSNSFQITLPVGKNLTGTDNAKVVVAVNFRGQCIYENQLVEDAKLEKVLADRVKLAAGNSKGLTLILMLDKAAEIQVLTHLFELANEAGITEVELAERPSAFGSSQ
jgi:biopolymer transport protein ExbD